MVVMLNKPAQVEAAKPVQVAKPAADQTIIQPAATVTVTHVKDKGKTVLSDDTHQEPVGPPLTKQLAMVGYEAGRVVGDGNFGSWRIGMHLTLPVGADVVDADIEAAFQRCWKFVNQKLGEDLQNVPGGAPGGK